MWTLTFPMCARPVALLFLLLAFAASAEERPQIEMVWTDNSTPGASLEEFDCNAGCLTKELVVSFICGISDRRISGGTRRLFDRAFWPFDEHVFHRG